MKQTSLTRVFSLLLIGALFTANAQATQDHEDLLTLFADWRSFETPPMLNGAPDYTTAGFSARHGSFQALRERLNRFNIENWSIEQQVDWHLVRAEMNGYDFNQRVLKPWARDPAFYQSIWLYRSDVPAHEGPTHHAVVELWTYDFPLNSAAQHKLAAELAVIPPLMAQARRNLTGNARDLWVTGIRDIRSQHEALVALEQRLDDAA
ncbi:MAG: hypothetical protein AB8B96_12050, partial [Lysobacterales bacterium]